VNLSLIQQLEIPGFDDLRVKKRHDYEPSSQDCVF